jgi:tight adherence protein B
VVIAVACLLLAAAALCLPGPVAASRLAVLRPAPAGGGRPRLWRAAPLVVAGLIGLAVAGPGGAVTGLLVGHTVRRRRHGARITAAAGAVSEQLADALRRIADELRSGSHPATALAGLGADGPLATEILAPAAAAARMGDDVPQALRRAAATRPEISADIDRLAGSWALAERHGIPLAELIAGAQDEIRWGVRFGHTVRSQLAGPRATATVLTTLPVLGIGLGQLGGADPVAVLRGGVLGQFLLVLGVGLLAAGSAWTERILRSAVPR